jgi:hypothetical protein
MTDSLGFIPSYFSENPKDQTTSRGSTVYTISYANHPESKVIYDWEDLRPLSGSPGETVYSVAEDSIHPLDRRVVEEAIERWPYRPLLEGTEVVVPVRVNYDGSVMPIRVRQAIILLPADSSS